MISVVILAKNEEADIKRCLESVAWCDEIIVINDHSTDKTVAIAEKMGAKVVTHSLGNDFAAQRNFGLAQASGDWVLFIDADEKVTSALWYEIMEETNNPSSQYNGFFIKRIDTMWGKELKHGETGNINLLRLAKKDAGEWEGQVHERWKVKGKTLLLKKAIMHYPHQTVASFLKEINYYTDLRAQELHKKKVPVAPWQIVVYPAGKFVVNYFFKLGFLDGLQGLVFALMMSFHSFLVRGKLWALESKNISTEKGNHL
ncbi:MAG: glycosyltransferase family 2 protein [Patescibacteria group bacterium]